MRRSPLVVAVVLCLGLLLAGPARAATPSMPHPVGCWGAADGCAPLASWADVSQLRPTNAVPLPDGRHVVVLMGREVVFGPGGGDRGVDAVISYAVDGSSVRMVSCLAAVPRAGCSVPAQGLPYDSRAATLSADGRTLFVAGSGVATIDVADPDHLSSPACAAFTGGPCSAPDGSEPDDVTHRMHGLAVAPDGRTIYASDETPSTRVIRRDADGSLHPIPCGDGGCLEFGGPLVVSADGRWLVHGGPSVDVQRRLPDGRLLERGCMGPGACTRPPGVLDLALNAVVGLAPGPDGTLVAVNRGTDDDAPTSVVRLKLAADGSLSFVGCTSDGLPGCADGGQPVPRGAEVAAVADDRPPVPGFAVSARGDVLAVGGADLLWRAGSTGALAFAGCAGRVAGCAPSEGEPLFDHTGGSIAFSPDGTEAWRTDHQSLVRIALTADDDVVRPALLGLEATAVGPGAVRVSGYLQPGDGPVSAWIEDRGARDVRRTLLGEGTTAKELVATVGDFGGPRQVRIVLEDAVGRVAGETAQVDVPPLDGGPYGLVAADPRVDATSDTSITVTSQVSVPEGARAEVRYGRTPALGSVAVVPERLLRPDHGGATTPVSLRIGGLRPGSDYYAQVAVVEGTHVELSAVRGNGTLPAPVPSRRPDGLVQEVVARADGTATATMLTETAGAARAMEAWGYPEGDFDPSHMLERVPVLVPAGDAPVTSQVTLSGLRPDTTYRIGWAQAEGTWWPGPAARMRRVTTPPAATDPTTPTTPVQPPAQTGTGTTPVTPPATADPSPASPPAQTGTQATTSSPPATTETTSAAPPPTTTTTSPSRSPTTETTPQPPTRSEPSPPAPPAAPSVASAPARPGVRLLGRAVHGRRLVLRVAFDAPARATVVVRVVTADGRVLLAKSVRGFGGERTLRLVLSRAATTRALRRGARPRVAVRSPAGAASVAVPGAGVSG